ncbi:MAG TPA: helix-turn-helix domain-containing protein [Chloroflexota bacterium]|nr:helix-turn-helix domain-containing protein [Chloroflexota bacterium]
MHTQAPEPRASLLNTVDETTEQLRVSRSKVYEYIRSGALKSVVIGRRRLVRRSDLEQFVRDLQPVA